MGKVPLKTVCVAHLFWPTSYLGGGGQNAGDFFVRVVAHLFFLPLAHLTE